VPSRPDVVSLLIDTAPGSPLTHRDGRRFTSSEIRTALSATPDDHAAARDFLRRPAPDRPTGVQDGSQS